MPAIFPVLLADVGGSIQCMHQGVFKGTASTTNVTDGIAPILTSGGFTVVTPCPGIPPTIPPCQLTAPALSMATRVTIDSVGEKPVTVMAPQISASNGMPAFVAKSNSTTMKVL